MARALFDANGSTCYVKALGWERHTYASEGRWRVFFTDGPEQLDWLGRPNDAFAVVDDFGNLVRVQ